MGDGMKKKRACFIGNPNVGKSSLFNFLTHKNEHTGNWTGKTVKNAYATFSYKDTLWEVVDLPGTYSLIGESREEKIASSFVCSLDYDLAIVVLDASNLERSIVLLLEVLDVTDRVIVCLNLMDEAKAQKIDIDLIKLQKRLNIPLVITKASEGVGCVRLCDEMNHFKANPNIFKVVHEGKINNYLELSKPYVSHPISYLYQEKNHENESFSKILRFYKNYITREELLKSYIHSSDSLLDNIVKRDKQTLKKEDVFWNKVLSHKVYSYLIMSMIFFLILWLTIFVSNIPSDFMFSFFSNSESFLLSFFSFLPDFIVQPLILGGYRTFYWVISVMLPPLIIFFPLFSYLEDYGLFPRIAFNMDKPFKKLTKKERDIVLYGSPDIIHFNYKTKGGNIMNNRDFYEGIINNLERRYMETSSSWIREWLEHYMIEHTCETCHGARLQDSVLAVKINKKNIYEVTQMSIKDLVEFFKDLKLSEEKAKIADLIIKEIRSRLDFLKNVGLEYLTLSRSAATLSGGEAQRIRLATQIGSKLTGVLYVLDEPSIGLHQRDNEMLIKSLLEMRDLGNTLIVVEHDTDTMLASDMIVDIGPGAGDQGGQVMAQGTPEEVMNNENSITGKYLSGKLKIEVPKTRRKGNRKLLTIQGATEHNLKDIDVKIPLGTFTCITGVSGSGKSTLINEILCKSISKYLYKSKVIPGKHKKIKGMEHIDKLVDISQSPIGRTPRSNPATYTGVFDDIRTLFTTTKEAKMYGYEKNRFSFNVKGGRCEACRGDGVKKIEMHFLPDVYVDCEVCHGTRYNRETLNIKYKGKNIAEVLDMRVSEALKFFENVPKIKNKLQVLEDVGLGYIKLGQSAPTLSGGEAERVKLAKELQKKATGRTLFVLDEPTTGLHTDDIKRLLAILQKIVDNGDTVVVIEHNLDVIKVADYIIDLGPEGGEGGGEIVATGTPEEVSKVSKSYTGQFLNKIL